MLRWGVLGTGFISHTMIEAIKLSECSCVEAIGGRNKASLDEFQKQYSIPRSFIDPMEMLEDPTIDIVYIGLPNHLHHSITKAAAENGKAVLSEKSLTTTMSEAHELLESVKQNQIFFAEGLMYLAHPLIHRFGELLSDGRLGQLKSISAYYCADIWDVVNPAGKGTLYNLACYPASLVQFVMQSICGDDAFTKRQLFGLGNLSKKDGNICEATLGVRFENGVLANLYSSDSHGMAHSFSITGEHGVIEFLSNPWLPVVGRNHIQWRGYDGGIEDIYIDDDYDAFYYQVKGVERAVSEEQLQLKRPSPRLSDSLEIMQFLTDWEESIVGSA